MGGPDDLVNGAEMATARRAVSVQLAGEGIEVDDEVALRIASAAVLGFALYGGLDDRCLVHIRAAVREMHAMMGH
ncbi:hypothetical protein AFCDBAGC_4892 [Methylobacterium cerastii]|uniref:TetR family transcriptional regulator n=1 Tax=Methylobacterium cerastii TaxID=932741 RepID=A0ABQ4QP36_9HYPH|nr:hypothetical protein [Methylobacterium cerastii]GJD47007.1 hypothetical protein AFCDBAGC_4892 [Methylobacterium cerastii]